MTEIRIPTFCALCRSRCGSISVVEDSIFKRQEPDPTHPTGKALCVKGRAAAEIVNNTQRLTHPLRRTNPKDAADPGWQRITWTEALSEIGHRINDLRDKHGPEAVAFSVTSPSGSPISDGIKWIERLVNVFGSPNLVRGTEICNWHKDFSHAYTFGRGIEVPDFRNAGCVLLWGHNPSATWLDHATAVAEAKARGAALIVIDPRHVGFAARADVWLKVRPGSDGALALGIANAMLNDNLFDRSFVRDWTNGPLLVRQDNGEFLRRGDLDKSAADGEALQFVFISEIDGQPAFHTPGQHLFTARPKLEWTGELAAVESEVACTTAFSLYKSVCSKYDAATVERITSVPAEQIRRTADLLHRRGPIAYYTWSGISQHSNATQTDRAIAILYALTGSFDTKGGNIKLNRHPTRDISGAEYISKHQLEKCVSSGTLPLGPAQKGWIGTDALYDAILDERPYPIAGLVGFGANILLSHASPDRARKALEKLEFYVHADVVMTPTAALADIVLPANTPWEREGLRVGFEVSQEANELIQLRPAVVPSLGESRSDAWIVFEMAKQFGLSAAFWSGDIDAGYNFHLAPTGVTVDELRRSPSGIRLPLKSAYRQFESSGFGTQTGKIEIYSERFLKEGFDPLPEFVDSLACIGKSLDEQKFPLILTSAKIPQYCHSQYRHVPSLRKRAAEPEVSLHPNTGEQRDIENGQWALVATSSGSVRMRARFDPKLDERVVVAQYGWWQANDELNLPALDIWSSNQGANFNRLIDDQFRDPISGSTSHRAYPCQLYALETEKRKAGWRPFKIKRRVAEAEGVTSLYLHPTDARKSFGFAPGQFLSIRFTSTAGKTYLRNYSISHGPGSNGIRISVKSMGSGSSALTAADMEGATVDIRGPFGRFTADGQSDQPLIMLAGGIGITPFVSILNHFTTVRPNRPVYLLYGIRTSRDFAFARELAEIQRDNPDIKIIVFLSEADQLPPIKDFEFRLGFVSAAEIARQVELARCEFMLCGPPGMVQALSKQLLDNGVERPRIRTEAFVPASINRTDFEPQQVVLAKSELEFLWQPDKGSLLDQIESLGVQASSGCRAGQCGSCRVTILEGQCAYPQGVDETDTAECLPCVAMPRSRIKLDL